jgi:hypothetical protein
MPFAILVCHSEWHEDGIDAVVGPFDTYEEAESYLLRSVRIEHGYVAPFTSLAPYSDADKAEASERGLDLDVWADYQEFYRLGKWE